MQTGNRLQFGISLDFLVVNPILFHFLESCGCEQLGLDFCFLLLQLLSLPVLINHIVILLVLDWYAHSWEGHDPLLLIIAFVRELLNFLALLYRILERDTQTLQFFRYQLPTEGL